MLRDYQTTIATQAAQLLREYMIAYLVLEPRVGKTLTSIHAAELYGAKRVLFLTPKKAIQSILNDHKLLQSNIDLTVINYEQIYNNKGEYDLIICDEAHRLGAFPKPSKKTVFLKQICRGKPIIYLSATATPESYSQLFHQFYVSSYSPFHEPNFYRWAYSYVTKATKHFYGKEIADYSNADKSMIDAITRHLFISYTQAEAGFEMPVNEHILTVDLKPATYDIIKALQRDKVIEGVSGNVILADSAVKLMQKMHQLYSGTVITEDGSGLILDDSKAQFIKARFAGQKIAVFYKYRAEEVMLLSVFGNVTTSPEEFNESSDKVFISQVQSGREGINLSTADCLVMLNIDFSAVSYFQSRARLQTKDRTTAANVYWLFARGGIENKIYGSVLNKRDYTVSYFKKDFVKVEQYA